MFNKRLADIIKWGTFGLLIVLPLVVMPWIIFPFVFGKVIFFNFLMLVLLFFAAVLLLFDPSYRNRVKDIFSLRITQFLLLVLVFRWISSLFGVDFDTSFWGNEERGMGLLFETFAFFWFVLACSSNTTHRDKVRFVKYIAISGLFMSLIALLRLKGYLLFGVDTGTRISGTMANALFFSALLIFYVYFSFLAGQASKRLWVRGFYYTLAVFQFGMIGLTQARSGVLGIALGLFVFFALAALWSHGVLKKRFRIALTILFLISGLFFVFRPQIQKSKIPLVRRVAVISLTEVTAQSRVKAWKSGIDAFRERPLLGWGEENFALGFDAHYNPSLLKAGFVETHFDRAHNIVIQRLVNGGILGLLVYVLLFVYVIWFIGRSKEIDWKVRAASIAVLAAYLAQLQFSFDTSSSVLMLYALFLFVTPRANRQFSVSEGRRISKPLFFVLIVMFFFGTGYGIKKIAIEPMQASSALIHTVIFSSENSNVEAIPRFEAVLEMPTPYKEEARLEYVKNVSRALNNNEIPFESMPSIVARAEEVGLENVEEHPLYSFYTHLNGVMYYAVYQLDPQYQNKAISYFERALEISPNRQQYSFAIGEIYSRNGEFEKALKVYENAANVAPDIGYSQWFKAVTLLALDRFEEARDPVVFVAEQRYSPPDKAQRMLLRETLLKYKRYDLAHIYFYQYVQDEPYNPKAWAEYAFSLSLAELYGDARIAAIRAQQIDSLYTKETEIFLDSLPERGEGYPVTVGGLLHEAAKIVPPDKKR